MIFMIQPKIPVPLTVNIRTTETIIVTVNEVAHSKGKGNTRTLPLVTSNRLFITIYFDSPYFLPKNGVENINTITSGECRMNTKTMEGLIGAGKNINLVNTPMRIYKEARRKGDTATMERAMGYVSEFAGKAEEYKTQADEGTREETREEREKARLEREKMIEKRRAERRKSEERIEESRNDSKNDMIIEDTIELSEEGMALLKEHTDSDTIDTDNASYENTNSARIKETVSYTKTGTAFLIT